MPNAQFTHDTAKDHSRQGKLQRKANNSRTAIAHAVELQTLVFNDAKSADDPTVRARLIVAWDTLEERKRILRMKPLPKAIDVQVKSRKQREHVSFAPAPASDLPKPE